MSYILDALNKSDQEQKRQATPDLHSLHGPADISHPSRRGQWISILVILLAINGAFFYWFSQRTTTEPVTSSNGSEETKAPTTESIQDQPGANTRESIESTLVTSPSRSEPELKEDTQILITPQDLARADASAGDSQPALSADLSAVRVAELPVSVQRKIPDLKFSSHIYADDSTLRMVNINGRFLREGDTIVDGIKLVGITEDGVILTYMHYTFEMSVIRDWSFD